MRVGLVFDPHQARAWHRELAGRMRAGGHEVSLVPAPPRPSPWQDRLLRFEARLRGRGDLGALARIPPDALDVAAAGEPDLLLVLDGEDARESSAAVPVWHLTADGADGLAALLAVVIAGGTPTVAIRRGATVLAAGRVGSEAEGLLLERAADALGRSTTLILAALAGQGPTMPERGLAAPATLTAGTAARLAATMALRRGMRRLERLAYRTPHWRVGWRRLDGPDLFDLRRHPDGGWRDLPDDGHHFYADPFPLLHDGRLTLFVEDYVHATGRGRISAVPFGPEGPLGRPEPVLECPYHLSYPFVFARDGAVWMIPESGEAGTVDLYRATRFPGGWVKDATLVSGVVAGDATLHEATDGRWWMFATVRDGGGASDALHLWSAPDFRGPWVPHPRNPVLVDIAAARPAGRMVVRDGALLRPVQDCRARYGAALGVARVTQLDDTGFAQTVDAVVGPGPLWPGTCLHTLNAAGGFEFIDGSGRARRPWREVGRS